MGKHKRNMKKNILKVFIVLPFNASAFDISCMRKWESINVSFCFLLVGHFIILILTMAWLFTKWRSRDKGAAGNVAFNASIHHHSFLFHVGEPCQGHLRLPHFFVGLSILPEVWIWWKFEIFELKATWDQRTVVSTMKVWELFDQTQCGNLSHWIRWSGQVLFLIRTSRNIPNLVKNVKRIIFAIFQFSTHPTLFPSSKYHL